MFTRVLIPTAVFLAIAAPAAPAGEVPEEFRIKRREVFEFAKKPGASRKGDRVTVRFATRDYCDVTIAVENGEGRIVRHLASGVLGKNAPPPFKKNSLQQTVVWDGKDDRGRYIDDKDSHTVRVSLGLRARYERHFLWSPYRRVGGKTPSICAQPEGVYVFEGSGFDHLRLFDHQGRYLRTVYPFPAGKLEEVLGLKRHTYPQSGKSLPWKQGFYEATLLTSGYTGIRNKYEEPRYGTGSGAMAVRAGRIALPCLKLNRFATDGSSGGMPFEGPKTAITVRRGRTRQPRDVPPRSAALSPDGKTLYITGFAWDNGHACGNFEWLHGVAKLDLLKGKRPELFAGSLKQGEDHAGSDNAHLKSPSSVDCDAKGRVYVADHFNDRIQVFDSAGKHLKTIRIRRPSDVSIDQRTGHIYVFSWVYPGRLYRGESVKATLTHLGPFEDPKKIAAWPLPIRDGYTGKVMYADRRVSFQYRGTVDSWSRGKSGPTIWFVPGTSTGFVLAMPSEAGDITQGSLHRKTKIHRRLSWDRSGIILLQEEDGKLVEMRDFGKEAKPKVPILKPPADWRQRLYVRPTTGRLYVVDGQVFDKVTEIDPLTGNRRLLDAPFLAKDMAFDSRGLIYLRGGREVARYDPDTWREVPFDYGEARDRVTAGPFTRHVRLMSAVPLFLSQSHSHEGGMWVSPKGHLVAVQWFGFYNKKIMKGKRRDVNRTIRTGSRKWGLKIFPGRTGVGVIHVWDQYGKLLYDDAIPGLGIVHGVAMDKDDDLYVMSDSTRVLGGKRYFDYMTGTLMKVSPGTKVISSDRKAPLPLRKPPDRPPDMVDGGVARAWVDGAKWFYGGLGFTGKDGGHAAGGCNCYNASFAFDGFARSFVPETQHYTVAVLDSAGNLVMRIGRYGNVDDGKPLRTADRGARNAGATPRSIGGDEVALFYPAYLATHSDRRLFITDPGNQRIVSVKLDYHASRRIKLKDVPDGEGRR
jgi:hypothetical protein